MLDLNKPNWARYLPHGEGILLLQAWELDGHHRALGQTVLARTVLGQSLDAWPVLWGVEILAQAAACLPVHGRMDGPRRGYLVKADDVCYSVAELPAEESLTVDVERTAESSAGLNICRGTIARTDDREAVLFEARFYLWNQAV